MGRPSVAHVLDAQHGSVEVVEPLKGGTPCFMGILPLEKINVVLRGPG